MGFLRHDSGELVYFTVPAFDRTGLVLSCFSTRCGGVSDGIIKGLNLGLSRPDSRENVLSNFKILCDSTGIPLENLVLTHQVHGNKVISVDTDDRGKGLLKPSNIRGVDGLITNQSNVALTAFFADCVPLFFLDPVARCIGLSHAGWRGTLSGIGPETLRRMKEHFGSKAGNVLVAIGPSICRNCYEVDDLVIDMLKASVQYWRELVVSLGKGKYLLDLQLTNERLLIDRGVPKENIVQSGMCTRCNEGLFYSYRREGTNTGSLAAILQLK